MSERVDFNIDCHDFDKSKSRNDKTKHEAAAKLAMKRLKRKGKNE